MRVSWEGEGGLSRQVEIWLQNLKRILNLFRFYLQFTEQILYDSIQAIKYVFVLISDYFDSIVSQIFCPDIVVYSSSVMARSIYLYVEQ